MSKYIITGVAGFVGRYFVKYLQNNEPDAQILGLDVAQKCDMNIKYQSINLNEKEKLQSLFHSFKPDYVLHLASISSVGQSWEDPAFCFTNNTGIMLNLLNVIRDEKLKTRLLSIGSSEEYGLGSQKGHPFCENMPLHPQNPYAVAKASQEMLCKLYAQSFDMDVMMTRSFNHIGPHQSERFVVPTFVRQLVEISKKKRDKMLVGNINVARDFSDVRDVVDAYYKILHQGKKGEVYNVCSGVSHKLQEIISISEEILGIHADIEVDQTRLRPNDVMLIEGDNSKLKTLGWNAKYTLRQTLSDVILSMN